MATIIPVLDLSVAHLSPAARTALDAASADALSRMQEGNALPPGVALSARPAAPNTPGSALVVTPTVHGWFCHCPVDHGDLEEAGVPADLLHIFAYARFHGAAYVLFDADADQDDALPSFEQ